MKKCPICNSPSRKFVTAEDFHGYTRLSNETFIYYKCPTCEALFLPKEKINKNFYKKYYPKKYYSNTSHENSIANKLTLFANKKKAQLLSVYTKNQINAILDIGAGQLKFLKILPSEKFRKTAIDIEKQVDTVPKNITFIAGDVTKISIAKQFDVITMWHFLEHYPNPVKLFKKLSINLKKEGIVVFSMPNTDSLGFKLAKQSWFHFDAPRHVILYNKATVMLLAEQSGFELIHTENMWYEFPTDLLHSTKATLLAPFVILLYPLLKLIAHETTCYVIKKK